MANDEAGTKFPWYPKSLIRGNLAVGNLRDSLLKWLRNEKGVHAETLLTTIGAITGFAAQNAVWKMVAERSQTVPNFRRGEPPVPTAGFFSMTISSGEKFYFGDLLNSFLYPQKESKYLTLWNCAGGAAKEASVQPDALPPVPEMFGYVTSCVGTANYGVPRVPAEHRASITAPQVIKMVWSRVRAIFEEPVPKMMGKIAQAESPLNEEHWPLIGSLVAAQFITRAKAVVDLKTAFTIVMESAIAASKIDPIPLGIMVPGKANLAP